MGRRAGAVAATGLVVLLGACGTGNPPATNPPATNPPSSNSPSTQDSASPVATSQRTDSCVAADLEGVLSDVHAGAGSRFGELVVTNRGGSTCTLYGYGGLEFFGANGKPTPTDLVRVADPGPSLVTLDPGETAAKKLRWGVVPGGDEPVTGPCQPPSTGARVIPPDDTRQFVVDYDFGSVCAGGRVEGSAYFEN